MTLQGQSEYTLLKQKRLESFLRLHMPIVKSIVRRSSWAFQKYLYLDLNAGSGYNEDAGVDGSPIIAARVAKEFSLPIYGLLYERDAQSAELLKKRLASYQSDVSQWIVLNIDHNEDIDRFARSFHGSSPYGVIYSDPNGADTPFSAYETLARHLPQLDALMNLNATVRKRCRGASGSYGFNPEFCKPLNESLKAIPKKHCYITLPAGRAQWTMAALMNYQPKGVPCGWYDILTAEGQDALDKATYTAATLATRVPQQMALAF